MFLNFDLWGKRTSLFLFNNNQPNWPPTNFLKARFPMKTNEREKFPRNVIVVVAVEKKFEWVVHLL